jgi:hypothetical protein
MPSQLHTDVLIAAQGSLVRLLVLTVVVQPVAVATREDRAEFGRYRTGGYTMKVAQLGATGFVGSALLKKAGIKRVLWVDTKRPAHRPPA